MDTEHLKYFVAVANSLNITQTAKEMFISQQALSSRITTMENRLGVKLFERTPSLSLTYAGRQLYQKALLMIETETQIKKEFAEINSEDRGIITLGISHTRGRVFLPRIFPQFRKKYPNVELILKEGNSRLLESYLKDGTVDMVIAANHFSKAETTAVTLLMERLFWVIPNVFLEQKYGGKVPQEIDIKEFEGYPFVLMIKANRIRAIMENYFQKIGIKPNVLLESDNIETTFSLAHQSMGITIYPEMFLRNLSPMLKNEGSVSYFPVSDKSTVSELVIAYKKGRYINKFERELIDICVNRAKNNF